MTNNSVCVFIWYSNWLEKVQMGHADARQGSFCLLPLGLVDASEMVHTFPSQFEYHMKTHTGLCVMSMRYPCLRGIQERRDRVELLGVAVLRAASHARPREADAPPRAEPGLDGEAGAQVLGLRLAAVELWEGESRALNL